MSNEEGQTLYESLTVLELLQLQQLHFEKMIAEPAGSPEYEDALSIRDRCIAELEYRKRCIYCGGEHDRRECHRLLSWDKMISQLQRGNDDTEDH